jgi:bifunctional UDP-N-acetylglucosamine pyrophosphorylase / glucosamine-1-phosphate N-acetyltransferase
MQTCLCCAAKPSINWSKRSASIPDRSALLTVIADDPRGFGRIVRQADGTVEAIVEEYVATPEQQQIKELNVGAYCFKADWLWDALKRIEKNPKKGEYYLTDIVEIAVRDHLPVQAVIHNDFIETIGINTRVHLSEAEAAMRMRINCEHMLNGVSMMDPAVTYIEAGVKIGKDTLIMPNTYIQGSYGDRRRQCDRSQHDHSKFEDRKSLQDSSV